MFIPAALVYIAPALTALAMVLWVLTEAVGGLALRGLSIPQIVWTRYLFHVVLMLLFIGIPRRFDFIRTRQPWVQLLRALMMLAMPLCFGVALQSARLSTVLGTFWVAPLIVLALCWAAGDRPSLWSWVAVAAGWTGAVLMYWTPAWSVEWPSIPALGMAASFSAYVVLTRVLDRTDTVLTNLFYTALPVLIVLTLVLPRYWTPPTLRMIAGGAAVAVLGWIALWAIETALRRERASRLLPFLFVQAIVEVGLRSVDRHVMPSLHVLIGAGVIVAVLGAALHVMGRGTAAESGSSRDRALFADL